MHDTDFHSPATTPGGVPPASSNGASTAHTSPEDLPLHDQDDDDQPPPAKRARIFSDADQASFTHVSLVFLCAPERAC
jgi:bromodomain-containing factor 1